jgi:hypothetical protein
MTEQVLNHYGIPAKILTDRRTVFTYKQKHSPGDEDDAHTQYAYACKVLGIELRTTSVPQAKGRVERMFHTLQNRLPIELRAANVKTIAEANEFLKTYLPRFNAQFAISPASVPSVFIAVTETDIERALSVLTERIVDSGSAVSFAKARYRATDAKGENVYFTKGTKGLIVKTLNGSLYFSVEGSAFTLSEIPKHEKASPTFDPQAPTVTKPAHKTIPPPNHPWRHTQFTAFRNTQNHRQTTG